MQPQPKICVAGLVNDFDKHPDDRDNKIARLQMKYTASEYRHVQIFFENLRDSKTGELISVTYTIDKNEESGKKLNHYEFKTFSKDGWDILTLRSNGDEEAYQQKIRKALRYCRKKEAEGCPYNSKGEQRFKVWPTSGKERSFFCSEFVMWVLIRSGFLPEGMYLPEETTPGTVMNICRLVLQAVENSHTLLRARKQDSIQLVYS